MLIHRQVVCHAIEPCAQVIRRAPITQGFQQPPQGFRCNVLRAVHVAHKAIGVAIQPLKVGVIDPAESLLVKRSRSME